MSMLRAALLVAALAWLAGCAQAPTVAAGAQPGSGAPGRGSDVAALDSSRDIVVAVVNPLDPPSTHAGSSLLGYAPSKLYGAGQRAASMLADLKQNYRLREVAGWPIKPLGLYCAVLEPPPGVAREELLKSLAGDARVQLAQPLQDFAVYADKPAAAGAYNDPYANLQHGFVDTQASAAQRFSQGQGVDVAVVDTGVDTRHPELEGRIRAVHNLVDEDAAAFDRDHHGTEVAGIIVANSNNRQGIVGMAPKAMLSIYKACWYPPAPQAGARCNSLTLAKALAAILDTNARIINLSLGGPADPLLNRLLLLLLSQGRIVVAAMPPGGDVHQFPDNAPGVLVVRASGAGAPPPGVLSAPGNDILTTQPGGEYDFSSGSSMAAAHVSGIAALLLSLSPNLDAHTVHDLLLSSSKVSGGALQVNAAAAVEAEVAAADGKPRSPGAATPTL